MKILLLFYLLMPLAGGAGLPKVDNYSPQEYHGHQQNFDVIQLDNGLMAFANLSGVMLFDGMNWELLPGLDGRYILTVGELDGRIYFGGSNTFGYYAPDNNRQFTLHDKSDQLAEVYPSYYELRNIKQWGQGTFLSGRNVLAFYKNGNIYDHTAEVCTESVTSSTSYIFSYHSEVYVACSNKAVYRWTKEQTFEPYQLFTYPGSELYRVIDLENNAILLVGDEGIYSFSSGIINHITIPGLQDHYEDILHATATYHGNIAISTRFRGFYVISRKGEIVAHLNSSNGLQNNTNFKLYSDREGQLWLAGNIGVDKIDFSAGIWSVDKRQGLQSDVLNLLPMPDGYYMGLQDGLYFYDHHDFGSRPEKISSDGSFFWDMVKLEKGIVAVSKDGFWHVDENGTVNQKFEFHGNRMLMIPVSDGYRVLTLGRGGWNDVFINRDETEFELIKGGEELSGNYHKFIQAGPYLWAVTYDSDLYKMRFNEQYSLEIISHQRNIVQDDEQIKTAFTFRDTLRISTDKGYYLWNSDDFEDDAFFNNLMAAYEIRDAHQGKEGQLAVRYYNRELQMVLPGLIYQHDGNWSFDKKSFLPIHSATYDFIYQEPDGSVWVSIAGAAIRFESDLYQRTSSAISVYQPVLKSIKPNQSDSLLYSIFAPTDVTEFPPDMNNLRFEFFAPHYRNPSEIRYQTRLKGFQQNWTDWRTGTVRVFTNLRPGRYDFQMRAKLPGGDISVTNSHTFRILPPWYLTIYAFLAYFLIAGLGVHQIYRYFSNTSRRRQTALEREISKRTHEIELQKEQLAKQAEELQFINNQRTQFFNNISHEFRTPLTLIMGPLQRLMEQESINEEEKQALEVSYRNAMRLRSLTNQMLDITRLQSGKMMFNPKEVDVKEIITNTANRFVFRARQENKDFGYRLPEYPLTGYFDQEKIDVILSNMIGNSFKFSKRGDKIIVTAGYFRNDKGENHLRIRVEDTGIGIPKDQQEFIFDYYYQVEMNELTYSEGTGIGLSYVKDLVDLHNGTITVDSRVGVFTSFDITLPTDYPFKEPGFDDLLEQSMKYFTTNLPVLPDKDEPVQKSPSAGTILIVEDNHDLQTYLKILFRADYDIMVADNGKEALEAITKKRPSLIISDVMMPEMDGWTFLEIIKMNQSLRRIPVIMLTALSEAEERIKALRTGVDDYIAKPFDKDELMIRVENLLKNYKERRKHEEKTVAIEEEPDTTEQTSNLYMRIISVIEEELGDPEFSSAELARKLAMSERSMYDKVKRSAGLTPVQLINQKRIEKSRKLLIEEEDMSINDIAFESGFSSSTYFSRTFKKVVGISPIQYRNRHK